MPAIPGDELHRLRKVQTPRFYWTIRLMASMGFERKGVLLFACLTKARTFRLLSLRRLRDPPPGFASQKFVTRTLHRTRQASVEIFEAVNPGSFARS